jgi:hypothetical protein
MSRGPSRFKQRDVARLVKATIATGLKVTAVRVDPQTGVVTVETGEPGEQHSSPLDEWMAKHARQAEGH